MSTIGLDGGALPLYSANPDSILENEVQQQFQGQFLWGFERYKKLNRLESYYNCTQHGDKTHDSNAKEISPEGGGGLVTPGYVPFKERMPMMPYRMAKIIINQFTTLIFGNNRFPTIQITGDEDSEAFIQALVKAGNLPVVMHQARTFGGTMGSVGISWCFYKGRPYYKAHNPKYIHIHKWEDRDALIPSYVIEIVPDKRTEWNFEKGVFEENIYLLRKDWTKNADVIYKDVLFEKGKEIFWEINSESTVLHCDDMIHFEWVQNIPSIEIDGVSDIEGVLEQCDSLDILNSGLFHGTIQNIDPTLILKEHEDFFKRLSELNSTIEKGSNRSINLSPQGSASYLSIDPSAVNTGLPLFESGRRSILETVQCVIPDPNTVAAQGTSSLAMKMLYAPMLTKGNLLRTQYGSALERMLEKQWKVAKRTHSQISQLEYYNPITKQATPAQLIFELPSRVIEEPYLDEHGREMVDENGLPFGKRIVKKYQEPGECGDIELIWPDYFQPTHEDKQKMVSTLNTAVGGKAIISRKTATEVFSNQLNLNSKEEEQRILIEENVQIKKQNEMFLGTGGLVSGEDDDFM